MDSNSTTNPNLALGKSILEPICTRPNRRDDGLPINICTTCEQLMQGRCTLVHSPKGQANSIEATDGNTAEYNEFEGFNSVTIPGTLTLDLEEVRPIKTLQFLLWDNCGGLKNENCNIRYQYRLLVSEDNRTWRVLFDCFRDGYCGWQRFDLSKATPMRYIRLHALTINDKSPLPFMVVAIEAYAKHLEGYDYRHLPTLHMEIDLPEQRDPKRAAADKKQTEKELAIIEKTNPYKLGLLFQVIEKDLQEFIDKTRGRVTLVKKGRELLQVIHSVSAKVTAEEIRMGRLKAKILSGAEEEFRKGRRTEFLGIISFVLSALCILFSIFEMFFAK